MFITPFVWLTLISTQAANVGFSNWLLWRLGNVHPETEHASRLEHTAANTAHGLLYFILLSMPATGYMGGDRARNYFVLLTIPSFKDSGAFAWLSVTFNVSWDQFNAAMDLFHHTVGRIGLPLLLAVHVGAALMHHIRRRDRVLLRMLPRLPSHAAKAPIPPLRAGDPAA